MKRAGAYSILFTMFTGLLAFLGTHVYSQVNKNTVDIAKIEEKEKSTKEILIEMRKMQTEMRSDIKFILRHTK